MSGCVTSTVVLLLDIPQQNDESFINKLPYLQREQRQCSFVGHLENLSVTSLKHDYNSQ